MNNALSHSFKPVRISDKLIFITMISSVIAHALAVLVIPNITFEEEKKPEPITIELVKPPAPEVIKPEPVKEIPKPKPIVKKIKEKKPKPIKKLAPEPKPKEIIQEPVIPEIVPPEPQVIAVPPIPEAPPSPVPPVPVEVTPPPPPPPPPGPSQSEIDSAKNAYGNSLRNAMIKHKKYPTVAKRRGWEGDVVLEFTIDGNGNILSTKIIDSSGYDALDNQAISMAEKAAPFPKPPATLAGQNFVVKVRIPFKLRSE